MSNFQNPKVPPTGGSHLPHAHPSSFEMPRTVPVPTRFHAFVEMLARKAAQIYHRQRSELSVHGESRGPAHCQQLTFPLAAPKANHLDFVAEPLDIQHFGVLTVEHRPYAEHEAPIERVLDH